MNEPLRITSRTNPLLVSLRRVARDGAAYRRSGEVCKYDAAPMVLPLSPELVAALDAEGYSRAIDEIADEFQFALRPA